MSEPLLVSVSLGCTIPIPGDMRGFVKPEMRIDYIDPAGDVEAQLDLAIAAGERAWARIDGNLEVTISRLLAPSSGVPTIPVQLAELEKHLDTARKNIMAMADEIKRQKGVLAEVIAVKAKKEPDGQGKTSRARQVS